jgi:hypothetical protein
VSAIRLRAHVPQLNPANPGPSIFTRALHELNRPPAPSPEQIRWEEIRRQIAIDVDRLLERARNRAYPDTMSVLSFYWMLTVSSRYTAEHWTLLERRIGELLADPSLSAGELESLGCAREWLGSARFAEPRRRSAGLAASPFTSERYAPPLRATQSFLEMLLNDWLPQSILERYGARVTEENWGSENAYAEAAFCLEEILKRRAVFPELETIRRLDRLQKRAPTTAQDLRQWCLRQQAALEALVTAPTPDASLLDPKLREILADVILYLLGSTEAAPAPQAGHPWLFPVYAETDLPVDLAHRVSEFALPSNYSQVHTLFIPVANWPLASLWRDHPICIQSSILTPDGRVWDARSVAQEADNVPAIVYRAIGRLEVKPTSDGLVLTVPMGYFPGEVSARFAEMTELDLYNRRWRMGRIEGKIEESNGTIMAHYHVVPKTDSGAGQWRSVAPAQEPLRWRRAS